jgi:hypothetical protein
VFQVTNSKKLLQRISETVKLLAANTDATNNKKEALLGGKLKHKLEADADVPSLLTNLDSCPFYGATAVVAAWRMSSRNMSS